MIKPSWWRECTANVFRTIYAAVYHHTGSHPTPPLHCYWITGCWMWNKIFSLCNCQKGRMLVIRFLSQVFCRYQPQLLSSQILFHIFLCFPAASCIAAPFHRHFILSDRCFQHYITGQHQQLLQVSMMWWLWLTSSNSLLLHVHHGLLCEISPHPPKHE